MSDRLCIQWTQDSPNDWDEIPFADWSKQPDGGVPVDAWTPSQAKKWPHAICMFGTVFRNYDHLAVVPLSGNGLDTGPFVRIVGWNDDPDDFPIGHRYAFEMDFWHIQADPRLGNGLNTKAVSRVYVEPIAALRFQRPVQNRTVFPWTDFVPPPAELTRHGIWEPDTLYDDHNLARHNPSWREWGLDGIVPSQREAGKWARPKGTKTTFLTNAASANGAHSASDELATQATAGSGTASESTGAGADEMSFLWTSPTNFPNEATWPTGDYRLQVDATTVDTTLTFAMASIGTSTGHLGRVNSAAASHLGSQHEQIEADFGAPPAIKLATTGSITPLGVDATHRAEWLIAQASGAGHGNEALTITMGSDSFADGPWTAPAGPGIPHVMDHYKKMRACG